MTDIEIEERQAGEAWARKALNLPERGTAPKTNEQRRNEWFAQAKAEREGTAIRSAPAPADEYGTTRVTKMVDGKAITYRTDLRQTGSHYPVGGVRTAMDGTHWKRVA